MNFLYFSYDEKNFYTESEQDYKLYKAVPLGITHSKHLYSSKSAKNEYTQDEREGLA
jgi:hypothetical protein